MTEEAGSQARAGAPRAWLGLRRTRIGAVVAVVLVIALTLWLLLRGSSSRSGSPVPRGATAVRVSLKGLKTLAALGIPIYWAGQRPGTTYELTKTADNRVFIRYLPAGVPIGSGKGYLTIGTYPVSHAFLVTSRLAASSGCGPGRDRQGRGCVLQVPRERVPGASGLRAPCPDRGLRPDARSRPPSGHLAPGDRRWGRADPSAAPRLTRAVRAGQAREREPPRHRLARRRRRLPRHPPTCRHRTRREPPSAYAVS